MKTIYKFLAFWTCVLVMSAGANAQQVSRPGVGSLPGKVPGTDAFDLAAFGPIATAAQASQTLDKALREVGAVGGGVIVIPANAPGDWHPRDNTQEVLRIPEAPAPAKTWKVGPGVTLLDARSSKAVLPQLSGMQMNRDYILQEGQSSPHWDYFPMLHLNQELVRGGGDYLGVLHGEVKAGADRKFFMDSARGIFPGQTLSAGGGKVTVKKLGHDRERHADFFEADAPLDFPAGTKFEARTMATMISANTRANNELQTFDIFALRHHYSQGDSYLIAGRTFQMGDDFSQHDAAPGEDASAGYGSVLMNARVQSETNIFRGSVAAFDSATGTLRYDGARNAHTLASGRPVINMNPKKWLTGANAEITNPGGALLNWGGSIRSHDPSWTPELTGRYFALDELDEYALGGDHVRRWYLITGVDMDKDGRNTLNVRRNWWGAKNSGVGISGLLNPKNYYKGEKLRWIIAPGSNVVDVADGVGLSPAESGGASGRSFKIVLYASSGTKFDFMPGDPIEQAIGPEPFKPVPFRMWMFDEVPGAFPSPALDIANRGTPRSAVLSVTGQPVGSVVGASANSNHGLIVSGDISGSLMTIHQTGRTPDVIPAFAWMVTRDPTKKSARSQRTLGVDTKSGGLRYQGEINVSGESVLRARSLGATLAGNNLRGIGTAVPEGATSFKVVFETAEANFNYSLTVQPGWLTDHAVLRRSEKGFLVSFSAPAPAKAKFDWLLVH